MKAVRIHEFGGPEVLKVEDVPEPSPGPGEVLVSIHAGSVNPVDYKIRRGGYLSKDKLPMTLGRDVAGVVSQVGEGAAGFQRGDAVYAMLPPDRGGYAEFVSIPAEDCARKPERLDFVQAAAVPLAALTAWQGLFDHGGLQKGQRVLIHGASGGVGHFAVQFARARGASVIATARGEDRDYVKSLGAMDVVDYQRERFEDVAHNLDLVFDLVGGETTTRSFAVLKPGGTLVCTVAEPDQDEAKRRKVRAVHYMAQPNGAQLAEIARLIDGGQVMPTVDRVFPLEASAEAERELETDHIRGKVVLKVD